MQKNNIAPQFEIIHMMPENTNSVLVAYGDNAVIFDAWGSADDWDRLLRDRGLNLVAIYSTHGHSDHIAAAPELARRHNVKWFLNVGDHELIRWANGLLTYFGLPEVSSDCVAPSDIQPGTYELFSGLTMNVISSPGHSAGGVMYHFPEYQILLSGDTLFRDSVGRTDFPTGDTCELRASIANVHDMNLPDETFVVHGHGVDSTIEILKQENPYFKSACECEQKCPGTCHCHCDHHHE